MARAKNVFTKSDSGYYHFKGEPIGRSWIEVEENLLTDQYAKVATELASMFIKK